MPTILANKPNDRTRAVPVNESVARAVRFVESARASDDARPTLQKIAVGDGYVVACDGFALHAARVSSKDLPLAPGSLMAQTTENGKRLKVAEVGKRDTGVLHFDEIKPGENGITYPNFLPLVPTRQPQAVITVNARLLERALRDASPDTSNHPVTLVVYGPTEAMEVLRNDGQYAMIMPLHREEREVAQFWRPNDKPVKPVKAVSK